MMRDDVKNFILSQIPEGCSDEEMKYEYGSGYNVLGYFEDKPSKHLPEELERLGRIEDVTGWLERNYVDQVYCNLPPSRQEEIVNIINYSERHFIRFFSVPNVRNYVHRALVPKMVNSMPVLTLRQEPLGRGLNRAVKRMFDIVFAGVFVVTCFWWIALIVAAITKIPKEYLEALGIRGGDKVRVELEDGKISVYNSDYNSHG